MRSVVKFAYLCMLVAGISVSGCAQDGRAAGSASLASSVPAVPTGGISPMSYDAARSAELAADYRTGLYEIRRDGHPARGWMLIERAAAAGNPAAQVQLGFRQKHGWGVPVDRATAMNLLYQAALQGYAPAEYDLAVFDLNLAAQRDTEPRLFMGDQRSLDWLRLSAAQHYDLAEVILAATYLDSGSATYDPAEGRELVAEASSHMVNARAAYVLSLLYDQGALGKPDPVRALHWMQWSADHRSPSAETDLGQMYADGHDVAKDPIQAAYWRNRGLADAAGYDGSADLPPASVP